jgi:hypothetical protein
MSMRSPSSIAENVYTDLCTRSVMPSISVDRSVATPDVGLIGQLNVHGFIRDSGTAKRGFLISVLSALLCVPMLQASSI